ncbi:MAG TPA: helicase-related protein [Thermoanaerobaculia bacterium]|nr:helicase-related protein [Thermoanaerobaculia bacterium]
MRSLRDVSLLAEHQLDAVERLLPLLARHGGAILADEPGLGKSYVAAEVARRAWIRDERVEAIVPASLVEQWRDTFRRFAVTATVITHTELLRNDEVPTGRRLIVVDEAHVFRNRETQRFAALARWSVGARLLLVTATPVCNGPGDLETLLRLIVRDDALADDGVPSIDVAFERRDREALDRIVSTLVVRRDRSVIPDRLAFGDLDRRIVWTDRTIEEIEERIAALDFPLVTGAPLVRDFLRRRLESSEAALLDSLRRQLRFYERSLECLASGRALPKREYRRAFAHEEDAPAVQTILFWELFVGDNDRIDPATIHRAIDRITELRAAVAALPKKKEELLLELCRSTSEPLLIFTGWTATARSIVDALRKLRRTVLVTGRETTNSASIELFRRGAADILVSTDVGAEGLNLQRAGVVVHYDLPWNPARIEQRNGRAHRIGQRRDVVRAVFFLPERHRARVLQTVAQKNRTRRRLLRPSIVRVLRPCLSLRPRIAAPAAVIPLAHLAPRSLPDALYRRHRAGVEALLAAVAREPLGEQSLRILEDALSDEPSLPGPVRFGPL